MKKFIKQQGFTLVEVVVAIAIVGGLMALVYAAVGAARRAARDAARKADMQALELDIEDYYGAEIKYPPIAEMYATGTDQICTGWNGSSCIGVTMNLSMPLGGATNFNDYKVPGDVTEANCECLNIAEGQVADGGEAATKDTWRLGYRVDSAGQNYCLYTRLENGQCYTIMPQH